MKLQCDVDVCHKRLYSAHSKNLHVEVVNIVHIRLMPAAFKATNFSTFNISFFCLFFYLCQKIQLNLLVSESVMSYLHTLLVSFM